MNVLSDEAAYKCRTDSDIKKWSACYYAGIFHFHNEGKKWKEWLIDHHSGASVSIPAKLDISKNYNLQMWTKKMLLGLGKKSCYS